MQPGVSGGLRQPLERQEPVEAAGVAEAAVKEVLPRVPFIGQRLEVMSRDQSLRGAELTVKNHSLVWSLHEIARIWPTASGALMRRTTSPTAKVGSGRGALTSAFAS